MKIRFQADANVDPDIVRGLCRRELSIDFQGHVGVIADGTQDAEVLKLAAEARRVLVTADVTTMFVHFAEFITHSESPGVILIPSSRPFSSIMEGLLLVWLDWVPEQLRNQILWLPHVEKEQ